MDHLLNRGSAKWTEYPPDVSEEELGVAMTGGRGGGRVGSEPGDDIVLGGADALNNAVKGDTISTVTFSLNGKRMRPISVADGKGRYKLLIRPSQLRPGPTLVVGASHSGADIAFEIASDHPTVLAGPVRGGGVDPRHAALGVLASQQVIHVGRVAHVEERVDGP